MNFNIPGELQDAIKENKLVIFVGAGVSSNCGLPNWKDLVINLLENKKSYIPKSDDFRSALDADIITPLEVLDKIEQEKKIVFEHFEKSLCIKSDSEIHNDLGKISKKFITTNFDKLIEHNISLKKITQESNYNLSKIDTEDNFVLKLHGDIDQMDKCIIFSKEYNALYREEKFSTFQLKKIFTTYNILFLGFSFSDPYVTELFNNITELQDSFGPKHFFISDNEETIRNFNDIKIKNIECINIQDYTNLGPYIKTLLALLIKTPEQERSVDKITNNNHIISKEIDGSDIAPEVTGWVGREEELDTLKSDFFKVVFITGIGGGGKSALASHYLQYEDKYDIAEWKDFKEQEHKFQHKIISMICRLNKKIQVDDLIGYSDNQLVHIFFQELGEKKSVFILDNVDSYIDLENFEPTNGVGQLFEMAMGTEHKSKFIFTCRPFIHYAKAKFTQLNLTGLTEKDTIKYFVNGGANISKNKMIEYAKESHKMTKGHALWLSLILAHSRKGENSLIDFLNNIGNGSEINQNDTSILSKNVLSNVWKSLHERDKLVLRTLAESVVAETKDDYAEILKDELNYKNYQKALRSLNSLNLIVEKRDSNYIELHPLVKEFVITNYPPSERNKYISYFVKYYDKWIVILKENLSSKLSYQEFTNFTKKAELYINANDFQSAINTLSEVQASMCAAGYIEEYLRVASLLFNKMTWNKNAISKLSNIELLIKNTSRASTEFGDDDLTEYLIERYSSIIEQKESNYIQLCDIKSYYYWFNKKLPKAISSCEEALYLLKRSGQDDHYNIKHTLALARRDTHEKENIKLSLDFFIKDKLLENLCNIDIVSDDDSSMLGNVGKCLSIQGDCKSALICLYKSFYLLFQKKQSDGIMNLGYASFWIAEVLTSNNKKDTSYYFFKFAFNCWKNNSPVLANRHIEDTKFFLENKSYFNISSQEDWRIEKYCTEFIERSLSKKLVNT